PDSGNRWVAPGTTASQLSHFSCVWARWFGSRTIVSAPPTMSRVGTRTRPSRPPTRSGRPLRDTMAVTGSRGVTVAAARAAAVPVLAPKCQADGCDAGLIAQPAGDGRQAGREQGDVEHVGPAEFLVRGEQVNQQRAEADPVQAGRHELV